MASPESRQLPAALRRVDQSGAAASTPTRNPLLIWAVALLLLCTLGLGRAALFDVDEGAFSEASREMLASGDWGHTTLNGADRFDKPILVYWLQASSIAVLGVNEFALRMPSALCTWAWALALALFAAPRWGQRTGMVAGTLLVTSLGVSLIGRAATADALLNLLVTLATLDLWRWAEAMSQVPAATPVVHKLARSLGSKPSGEAAIVKLFVSAAGLPVHAPKLLRRAALWIGLGLLAKGPVAILVPGAALLIWCLASKRWRLILDALRDPWAWAIVIGVAAPWYGYALARHGQAFIDGFFIKHNLARYGGALEGHGGGLAYYVVVLPLLLLPWSALLVPLIWRAGRLWAEPLPRFLLLWAAFVLVFFSFSGTKLPHYLLYGFSPVVLLCARWLTGLDDALPRARLRLADQPRPASTGAAPVDPLNPQASATATAAVTALSDRRALGRGLATVLPVLCLSMLGLLALAAVLPLYLPEIAAGQSDALYRTLLGGPVDKAALALDLWVGLALAGVLILAAWWWPTRWGLQGWTPSVRAGVAGVVTTVACAWLVLPWWAERLQGPVKAAALQARAWADGADLATTASAPVDPARQRTVVQWRLHQPSFALYLGRPTELRPPRQGELALVRLDRLPPGAPGRSPAATPAATPADAPGTTSSTTPGTQSGTTPVKPPTDTSATPPANLQVNLPADASAAMPERWRLVHQARGYGLLLWLAADPAPDSP